MILKASERGGGKQLGLHLLKTEENEHVEVHEIRGFMSDDIVGAFKEAYAVSRGTKCRNFLFSVSLNPPETESVGVDAFEDAVNRIEEKAGLSGQPRVIVFHEKEGRRHAHAVWSRIDADSMTAVNLSHYKLKLRDISKQLYLEHGWTMPRGLMDSAARDPRNFTLDQWQQAKRMGMNARDLKSTIQECWAVSDSRAAFEQALGERGLILAKGDRRGHVAVTHEGEVLSIARYTGKKAKEVRAKLGEPDALPSADDARARMSVDMAQTFERHFAEARQNFQAHKFAFDERRTAMTVAHTAERAKVDAAQHDRWRHETRERQVRFHKGMRGLWDRLTGQTARIQKRNEEEAYSAFQRDREQRDALVAAQLEERRALTQQLQAARAAQAGLLKELRQDRSNSVHDRLEQFRDSASPRPGPQPAQDFRRVAQNASTQQERLARVRNDNPDPQPAKGPELDRQ